MIREALDYLRLHEESIWMAIGFPMLILLGLYFTVVTRGFQVRGTKGIIRLFRAMLSHEASNQRGVHPLKVFFASVGGCVGIGNVVGVVTAVKLGGPGAVFWVWATGLIGTLIKYAEVYLGIKYRVQNEDGSYDGGPMYYLRAAFNNTWIPKLACFLLCFYGIELFMFKTMTESVVTNWNIPPYVVVPGLLFLVLYAVRGGVERVGEICTALMPIFMLGFLSMSCYVFYQEADKLSDIFSNIFSSAFSSTAAIGGFTGATVASTIGQGIARGAYTGDIGVGYASIIHAETCESSPHKQACLAILGIFLDTFLICTLSMGLVLVTDVWHLEIDGQSIPEQIMVQTALGKHFSFMWIFMPLMILLLGYSTMIAYFVMGIKCAKFLAPRLGPSLYFLYAVTSLVATAFLEINDVLLLMGLNQLALVVINVTAIFKLRKEIRFEV